VPIIRPSGEKTATVATVLQLNSRMLFPVAAFQIRVVSSYEAVSKNRAYIAPSILLVFTLDNIRKIEAFCRNIFKKGGFSTVCYDESQGFSTTF
jgi:hypothetical protein